MNFLEEEVGRIERAGLITLGLMEETWSAGSDRKEEALSYRIPQVTNP